ncbi:MAG: cadmium-translocating P-type ATPase [Bacillota bacterium]|nr:MAG: cadmium-translocating P-type ATPase [Bacillota bacterium]
MTKKQLYTETISVSISIIFIVAATILTYIGYDNTWFVIALFGLSFLIGGYAKAREGILATIKNKSLNVEILMILAALGAFFYGNYSEGAILILIFSISGVLESYATSKSEKALTSLLKLAPKTAVLIVDGIEKETYVADLKVDDLVVVRAGGQVPVDGVITQGASSLNQAAITGEFVPVYKDKDDQVFAGSINIESQIIVKTTKDPKDSVVQKIIDFVKKAQENQTKTQTVIDKIEKYYVYAVILISIGFMVIPPLVGWLTWDESFYRGIIVLVVGSPCALVASITPAMLSALSNAAHHRILIKGGTHLEQLIGINKIVLDKTGTITSGVPKVVRVEVISEVEEKDAISILYTLEKQSSHPLAKAIVKFYDDSYLLKDVPTQEIPGKGMEAKIGNDIWRIGRFKATTHPEIEERMDKCTNMGHSLVSLIKNDQMVGFVALMDTIRDDAKTVMDELKTLNIETILLTGDNNFTAHAIAKEVGIQSFKANCLPEDKVKHIENLQKEGHQVLMVGDGINDAPALAIANVSVAMGTGTDVSLETADIIFMNDKLQNLTKTIKLAKRMRIITIQNIVFAVGVISFLMISNVFGIIKLPAGVVAHEMSTILVILNSLRLLFK